MTIEPSAAGFQQSPESYLVQVGDIGVSQHWVVTPNGTQPLKGSQWLVADRTMVTQHIPTWAIVMTVITVWFFLLGLLFLLAKENRISGYVEVTVRSGPMVHMTQIPVYNPMQSQQIRSQVAYAQQLAAAA